MYRNLHDVRLSYVASRRGTPINSSIQTSARMSQFKAAKYPQTLFMEVVLWLHGRRKNADCKVAYENVAPPTAIYTFINCELNGLTAGISDLRQKGVRLVRLQF